MREEEKGRVQNNKEAGPGQAHMRGITIPGQKNEDKSLRLLNPMLLTAQNQKDARESRHPWDRTAPRTDSMIAKEIRDRSEASTRKAIGSSRASDCAWACMADAAGLPPKLPGLGSPCTSPCLPPMIPIAREAVSNAIQASCTSSP